MSELTCPRCGQPTVECTHWDDGSTFCNDNFRHECKNPGCDFAEERLNVYGGQSGYEDPPYCPMCGRLCLPPACRHGT